MQLFDDLEDFGSLRRRRLRRRAGPVHRAGPDAARGSPCSASTCRGCRTTSPSPSSWCTATTRSRRCCGTTRRSRPPSSSRFFGDALGKHVMLGMDEPEHRRYRSLVSAAFSQKALARRQDELVERVANELIDRFAERGRADLVREFTFPYPTQIIAGLLGLPREDYPQFQRWSISLLSIIVNRERADRRLRRRCGTTSRRSSRRGGRSPATTSSAASRRPRSTESTSRTRRSSRSCACCSRPASRPRTARPGTCCSGCSPTPSSSTPFAPIGR